MDSFRLLPADGIRPWPSTSADSLALTRVHAHRVLIVAAVVLALAFRLTGLSAYGFSDDEVAKLRAIERYRHGDFSANAEHPMLMKLAMWASLDAAAAWSAAVPAHPIAPEAALRWPNAIAGAATVGAIGGATSLLFSPLAGALATVIVALDPNVTALNRIGKEDTFLMLFFMLGVWGYERAKQIGMVSVERAQRFYLLSAASFGLMLASKYMPYFFGLYLLYHVIYQRDAGANVPDRRRYYLVMLATFVAANFAVLLPSTWAYCLGYLRGDGLHHHGFAYARRIYLTSVPLSTDGVPATYYLRLMATKAPLPILAGAAIGLVPLVRHRRERGFVWLAVLLLIPLLGYSLAAAKFQRYALPMLLMVDILAAVGFTWLYSRAERVSWDTRVRLGVCAATAVVVVGALAAEERTAAPFYSLHQNPIGARIDAPATTFPEEAYDLGVREAVRDISAVARSRAVIVSDVPNVVQHYVEGGRRHDLAVRALSADGLTSPREQWVLVQDGHVYVENVDSIAQLRRAGRPWRQYRVRGACVLQVYRLAETTRAHG